MHENKSGGTHFYYACALTADDVIIALKCARIAINYVIRYLKVFNCMWRSFVLLFVTDPCGVISSWTDHVV